MSVPMVLRALTFKVCSLLAPSAPTLDSSAGLRQGELPSAVPVGDLEREVDVKLTVATTDDDMADLEQWSFPNETRAEADARVILRCFAARWWKYSQEKQASAWLSAHPSSKNDAGIKDCLKRIRATSYWTWPRGSRVFFWKVPLEWFSDIRDGVPF